MPQAIPVISTITQGLGTLGTIGAVAGVAGTVASISASNRSARAQRQAAETQQRIQAQQATRQRRQAIRANILRRSQLQAQGQALGAEGSSALSGGLGSLSSQLGGNLGFGSVVSGLNQQFTGLTAQAAQQRIQAQLFETIGGIGFGVAKRGQQISGLFKSEQ